jgi:hypothetical protein
MMQFKLGRIAASIADFDRAEQLDSALTPYLWQRDLSASSCSGDHKRVPVINHCFMF